MKAVMYGAGSIGRGFIAQLFSESGYETVFIDVNKTLIDHINYYGEYPLRFVRKGASWEMKVSNVRGIYGTDEDAVADEISTADLMATSVGKNVLPLISGNIAEGLRRRWISGNLSPLNIIVCENMIKANLYLKELILSHMSADETILFEKTIGIVETCIGRNVPVMTEVLQDGHPLRVIAEDYSDLPVDAATIKGPVPHLMHMLPKENFSFYIKQKLFVYNMAHAAIAYLGYMRGIEFLCDASKEPDIKYIGLKALCEISLALSREYKTDLEQQYEHACELLYRFGNRLLGISVLRVAFDPVRKLSGNDRLVGSARECIANEVFPAYIAVGIAAGYCFFNESDHASVEIQNCIKTHGIEHSVTRFSGLDSSEPLYGSVLAFYKMFISGKTLKDIIDQAEEIAQKQYH